MASVWASRKCPSLHNMPLMVPAGMLLLHDQGVRCHRMDTPDAYINWLGGITYYLHHMQAYLLFGDEEYLDMFSALYVAAMRHLRPKEPGWAAKAWLGEVHLHNGIVTRPWISSLSAFWPGLQATIGELLLHVLLSHICEYCCTLHP